MIEYAPTIGLDVGLIEEFGGTSLNSAVWSGSASVAGGIASIGSEIRTKDSFQIGNATRLELRMRRISSPHVWAGIREISPGTASIDFGDNPYAGGMALAVHGPFGENAIHNSTPTAEWQEYRVTVSGDTAVLSRGSTLNNLTETLTQTLQTTASGRNMTFSVNPYGTAEIDWVKIYEPFSIEGVIVYPGGRPGKVSLVSGASSYIATSLGNYKMQVFNGPQQVSAFLDENDNGNREPWEPVGKYVGPALNITGPTTGIDITLGFPADTDNDGMSDEWELANGLNPSVNDAQGDLDGDGLANITEYRLQTQVGHPDSDGDGLSDGLEIAAGTNPLLADADGDGMDDSWETTYGLNPLIYDAVGDLDLDGLTNKEEYDLRATGYRPNAWNSKTGTSGDYRSLKGEGWTRRGYDKLDRLISTEKDTGFAQLYRYDGNSNKTKDVVLAMLDTDGDCLPDAWEFANGLTYSGVGSVTGDNGPNGDLDLDGFTNQQEWLAGTNPKDAASHPSSSIITAGNVLTAATGFTPSNWVMAAGQLDGLDGDEIVISADGAAPTTNSATILKQKAQSWTTVTFPVSNVGITSIAVGPPSIGTAPSIFLGTRTTLGGGGVAEYAPSANSWISRIPNVATSTGTGTSYVVQVSSVSGVAAVVPSSVAANDGISQFRKSDVGFNLDFTLATGSALPSVPSALEGGGARWLASKEIQYSGGKLPGGSIRRGTHGSLYTANSTYMTQAAAETSSIQLGGHLVTIDSQSENDWIFSNYNSIYSDYWIGLTRDAAPNTPWRWLSSAKSTFRKFGQYDPASLSNPGYTGVYVYNSSWYDDYVSSVHKSIIEFSPNFGTLILPISIEETSAKKLIWRGKSIVHSAFARATDTTSLVYAYVDDLDSSTTPSIGDNFVVGEYEIGGPTPVQRTLARLPLTNTAGAYGLTTLHRIDLTKPSTLAIGEPDGTVSLWTAPDATSPLVRKVFTTEFQGKAWHQLEVFHEANGTEGLVGLLVDPATPAQCQLIHWSPESIEAALNGTAPVLNNVPSSRILPAPSQGGATGSVAVRIWDAEAHGSSLELQYQRDGEVTWSNATVTSVDGTSFQTTLKLTSQPAGMSHSLAWNAAANLGSAFSGTVLLRTRATDSQTGEWSPAMPYAVNTSINLDTDGDGMPDAWEASHGLVSSNPADGTSDSDGDGITAFLEYALAMNPTVTDVALLPVLGTKTKADGKHLTLTYRRPINSGLTYTAERSVTLAPGNWQFGTTVFQELTPLNLGDGTEFVTVEDLNPMAASSRAWLRLRVSK